MIKPIAFSVKSETIYGILQEPNHESLRDYFVIFISGPGTNRCGPHRIHCEIATMLERNNMCSFRFDFRSRGESSNTDCDLNIEMMFEDTLKAYKLLSTIISNNKKYIVIGNCLGCVPGLKLMEMNENVESGIFLGSTRYLPDANLFVRIKQFSYYFNKYIVKLSLKDTWLKILKNQVNYSKVKSALKNDPRKYFFSSSNAKILRQTINKNNKLQKKYEVGKKRVLFIYGEYDPLKEECLIFYKKYCYRLGWYFESVVISGADRTFNDSISTNIVMDKILKWIAQYI